MNHKELEGKVVQFNANVDKTEIDFEPGQKARIIKIMPHETIEQKNSTTGQCSDIEILKVLVDFSEFEKENKKLATRCYYPTPGQGGMVFYHEKSYYPKDGKYDFYVEENELNEIMTPIMECNQKLNFSDFPSESVMEESSSFVIMAKKDGKNVFLGIDHNSGGYPYWSTNMHGIIITQSKDEATKMMERNVALDLEYIRDHVSDVHVAKIHFQRL